MLLWGIIAETSEERAVLSSPMVRVHKGNFRRGCKYAIVAAPESKYVFDIS